MRSAAATAAEAPNAAASSSFDARQQPEQQEAREIWFREDERWELTWPIWHMLPRHERKALAVKHGYKTIGEFEEYMSLQRGITDSSAISDSDTTNVKTAPYDNRLAYPPTSNDATSASETTQQPYESKLLKKSASVMEEEEEDSSDDDDILQDRVVDTKDDLSSDELLRLGGKLLLLPEETLHRIFEWLPVDTYATLALVSPHWRSFTRTEAVYKKLCERLYLNQSKRRALHVHKFGNSYRTMLEKRPRVRAGGGIYVMKYCKVKKIQRDLWTEIPVGAVLEMVYYRYCYFLESGKVLYALTPTPPHEMFRRFRKVCLAPVEEQNDDPAIVWGTYQVQKTRVTVHAQQSWQHVQLDLTIQPDYLQHGRWGFLSFDRHMSSASNNFEEWSPDRCVYEVPEEPFRFVRDKRL